MYTHVVTGTLVAEGKQHMREARSAKTYKTTCIRLKYVQITASRERVCTRINIFIYIYVCVLYREYGCQ